MAARRGGGGQRGAAQDVVTLVETIPLAGLRDRIEVRTPGAAGSYARVQPEAIGLINEAATESGRIFGPGARIALDIPGDYEDEGVAHLYVRILTNQAVDDALDALDLFNAEWWFPRFAQAPDTLHFVIEYV